MSHSIEELQEKIGYVFQDQSLLKQAITHSSYANERKVNKVPDYERIEFLGDAVLELVSSEYLYKEYPECKEGKLTKIRASLVCEQSLAFCADTIDLGQYLNLGKGEELTGGRHRASIIADVVEAIIGAIYLDSGFEEAKSFIHRLILSDIQEKQLFYDAKTILQELVQKEGHALRYDLVKEEGPEHNKVFYVDVYEEENYLASGSGHSKKLAEQHAAYAALLSRKSCI
ncbi:MAG: ribonuclease III [Lachnospiraceae bacterium]|jgi:ribonuclease-3|nr:ribonuclease III [Lachnospiraceae bacterium]MBR1849453.1 ribonuclease III [Lachnospiraceae bacterium]